MRRAALICILLSSSFGADARAFVWPSTVDRVARQLEDPSVGVRRRAARELFDLSAAVVARLGSPAINDPDPEVRVAALEALFEARVSGLGARVVPWLADSDAKVRRAAAGALAKDPAKDAAPALGRVLSDPESAVRVAAARALGASGSTSAVVPLLGRLDDPDPDVREAVIRSLSRLGEASSVVPLVGKIQDNRPSVRRAVAVALGFLGDGRASSALVLLLRDADETVRAAALEALGKIRAVDAVATIVSMLDDERRPLVREAALSALADIPSDAGIEALVDALAHDDPRERSPVRAALVRARASAVPKLDLCLQGQPSFDLADGCALALGEMRAPRAVEVVDAALRRGIVRPEAALRALGASGDGRALVTVLEHLSSDDPWVRRVAVEAATALLDPDEPDGRAVEPILRALDAAHGRRAERSALVALLGRTGSPRAVPVLVTLAGDALDPLLRLAAIQALGMVGRAGQDAVLMDALGDPQPGIRLAAALSLRKVGSAAAALPLLDRLDRAAEEDRAAVGLSLAGPLSVTTDRGVIERASELLETPDGAERDVLVEALGAAPGALGSHPLALLAPVADAPTRAKVAEALAGHPEALDTLRALARDPDPSVRANAVWSLGAAGERRDVDTLGGALGDGDPGVRGNAAAALGLLGARGDPAAPFLCRALGDDRAYVRANALSGLALMHARCASGVERELVRRDPSEAVRTAAARLVLVVASGDSSLDRALLARCRADEPSAAVAASCGAEASAPEKSRTVRVSVYVVPAGATAPVPRAPFALVRKDGLLRSGLADRRGVVTETFAPKGTLRLEIPVLLVP